MNISTSKFRKNIMPCAIALVCFCLFIFNFWLFYPGYMTSDWFAATSRNVLIDHQPIIYSFLLRYIHRFFGFHIHISLLFNLIPFYLGIYGLILGLWKKFHSHWCWLGLLPIGIGNIFFNNYIIHSSFSSPMLIFLLWSIVLYQILAGVSWKNLIAVSFAFLFALLSRHNAIVQVYPIFFIYSYFIVQNSKSAHKLIKYICLCFLFAFFTILLAWGIPNMLKEGQAHPSTHIFLHQIAGACVPNHDENCFLPEWYVDGKTYAEVEKDYIENPLDADFMCMSWKTNHPFKHENLNKLQSMWLNAIIKYPYDYMHHIMEFIINMWRVNADHISLSNNHYCPHINAKEFIFPKNEIFYEAPKIGIKIYNLLYSFFPTIQAYHFVCLNFVLFIISGILFIKKRDYLSLYVLSSSIAGIASSIIFCIFSPIIHWRYIYPVLISTLCAVIGIIISFFDKWTEIKNINFRYYFQQYKKHIFIVLFILLACGTFIFFNHPLTARVDIFTTYNKDRQFIVHRPKISFPLAEVDWMTENKRRGVVVEQFGRSMKFTVTALQDADITFELKGPWMLNNSGGLNKKWVKFTSFKINGKSALPHKVKVWNAMPYTYVLHAKKNNSYQIQLKWRKK